MIIIHIFQIYFAKEFRSYFYYYYRIYILKVMSGENNLEKSSQDYKKSQYGSWYKKSAENKKNIPDPQENSFLNKLKKFFKK